MPSVRTAETWQRSPSSSATSVPRPPRRSRIAPRREADRVPADPRGRTIAVTVEVAGRKAFASAVDWPGWSRPGKTEEAALAALGAYADRYAAVATEAGQAFEPDDYDVVEQTGGGSGTEFGVPSSITDLDHRAADTAEAERQARLVQAAWVVLDRVSATAPAELRKGPRGGGRDRDKMLAH